MRKKNNYKYNYFYKITNLLNGHFYYGIHSTNNLDDGYMGSGHRLHRAYKKYGQENFSKEILKFFETREELVGYEVEIVTDKLVQDENCYNIVLGGEKFSPINTIVVFNKETNIWERIAKSVYDNNKEKYDVSGNNHVIVKYKNDTVNNWFAITCEEYYNNKDKYECIQAFQKDTIIVSLKTNPDKQFIIDKKDYNPEIHNRSKTEFKKGQIFVKDNSGNHFRVSNTDERFLNGELKTVYTGFKWSDEQKENLKNKFKEIKHQSGEKNSQYGTKWMFKDDKTIKVKKEQVNEYISNGWQLGSLLHRKKKT